MPHQRGEIWRKGAIGEGFLGWTGRCLADCGKTLWVRETGGTGEKGETRAQGTGSDVCGGACPAAPQTGTGANKKGASPQQYIWFIWSLWFVLFIWLNETNQMNQINQINKTNQTNQLNETGGAGEKGETTEG
jgi:hypothetical protein